MAKRKKLNKRVVIVLVAFGVVLVALAGVGVALLPKNHAPLAQQARQAQARGDLATAVQLYNKAISATKGDRAAKNTYLYELGKLQWEWAQLPDVTSTDTDRLLKSASEALQRVVSADPSMEEAQRLLCDLLWAITHGGDNDSINTLAVGVGVERYINQASKLIALAKNDHVTYFRRALARAGIGVGAGGESARAALEDFDKAISLKNDEVRYWQRKAEFLELRNSLREAEETYFAALEANPDKPELLVVYARFLFRQQPPRTTEAEAMVTKAAEAPGDDPIGKLSLADLRASQGKPDEAMLLLLDVKKKFPQDPRSYLALSMLFQGLNRPQEAVAVLQEGLDSLTEQASSAPAEGRQTLRIANARRELNDQLANALLDVAMLNPADKDKLMAQARQCLAQLARATQRRHLIEKIEGRLAMLEGDPAKAIKLLERANAGFEGRDVKTLQLLVYLYRTQKQLTKAEALIDMFLAQPANQNNAALLLAKADLEIEYRLFAQAAEHVRQALAIDPSQQGARSTLAALRFIAGPGGPLPADLEMTPQATRLLTRYAADLWDQHRRDEAIALVEEIHQRLPGDLGVASTLAAWYAANDREADAQALLDKLLASQQDDPSVVQKVSDIRKLMAAQSPEESFEVRMAMADRIQDELEKELQKAAICQAFGKRQQVREFLAKAQQINPQAPMVIVASFRSARLSADWDEAEKWVKQAQKLDIDRLGGRSFAAELAMSREQYPQAIEIIKSVLADRSDKRFRVMLGDAYLLSSQLDKAEAEFQEALKIDRTFEPALIGLAQTARATARPMEERKWVTAAIAVGSRNSYVIERWLLLREAEDPEAVLKDRQRIFELDPGNFANGLALARLCAAREKLDDAEKVYRHVYERSPQKLGPGIELVKFYIETKRPGDADKLVQELLAAEQNKAAVYVMYGQVVLTHNNKLAGELFGKAIEVAPDEPLGYAAQARFLAAEGQHALAADTMAKALELRPEALGKAEEFELILWRINAAQYDKALSRLDRILQARPNDPDAMRLKIQLFVARKDFRSAEDMATRAFRAHPSSARPLQWRAAVYRQQGELEKCRADLEAAVRLSESPDVGTELGVIHMSLFEQEKARQAFAEVTSRWPDHLPAITGLTEIYLQKRAWSALEPLLDSAKKRYPRLPQLLVNEARMWQARGDQVKRVAALAKAYELDGGSSPYVVGAYLDGLLDARDYDTLGPLCQELLKNSKLRPLANGALGAALAAQNRPEADSLFVTALREAPPVQFEPVLSMAKEAYGGRGLVERMSILASAQPDSWQLQHDLGMLCIAMGDLRAAENQMADSLRLAQAPAEKAAIQIAIGTINLNMAEQGSGGEQELAKAEQMFLEAAKTLPDNFQLLNNLAYLYASYRNDPGKALPYARKAARQVPNGRVLDTYGWALARIGEYDEAEKILVRAVVLEDKLAQIRYHLGWVYAKSGQYGKALNEYRLARELAGSDDLLRRQIEDAVQALPR